jgi:hypothetical protein
VASVFRDPLVVTFVDADNREIARLTNPAAVPRVGENVLIRRVPYIVERVGYDIPADAVQRIWLVCRPA